MFSLLKCRRSFIPCSRKISLFNKFNKFVASNSRFISCGLPENDDILTIGNGAISRLCENVINKSDSIVLIRDNYSMCNRDLYSLSLKCAIYLRDNYNIKSGDTVCCLAHNRLEIFPLIFACHMLNCIFLPNPITISDEYINDAFNRETTKLIICEKSLKHRLKLNDNKYNIKLMEINDVIDDNITFIGDKQVIFADNDINNFFNDMNMHHNDENICYVNYSSCTTTQTKLISMMNNFFNPHYDINEVYPCNGESFCIPIPYLTTHSYAIPVIAILKNNPCILPSIDMINCKSYDKFVYKIWENIIKNGNNTHLMIVPDLIETFNNFDENIQKELLQKLSNKNKLSQIVMGMERMERKPLIKFLNTMKKYNISNINICNVTGSNEAGFHAVGDPINIYDINNIDKFYQLNHSKLSNTINGLKFRINGFDGNNHDIGELQLYHKQLLTPKKDIVCYDSKHESNKKYTTDNWLKTGDIIKIDNNNKNKYKVLCRNYDVIYINNKIKLYPNDIENILLKNDFIYRVFITNINLDDVMYIVAFIDIDSDINNINIDLLINQIKKEINELNETNIKIFISNRHNNEKNIFKQITRDGKINRIAAKYVATQMIQSNLSYK